MEYYFNKFYLFLTLDNKRRCESSMLNKVQCNCCKKTDRKCHVPNSSETSNKIGLRSVGTSELQSKRFIDLFI